MQRPKRQASIIAADKAIFAAFAFSNLVAKPKTKKARIHAPAPDPAPQDDRYVCPL